MCSSLGAGLLSLSVCFCLFVCLVLFGFVCLFGVGVVCFFTATQGSFFGNSFS